MDGEALSSSVSTLKPPRAVKRAAFAGRVFDVARDELLAGRATVPLGPKARLLLKYFLDHPERVLGKEELLTAMWGSTVVTENSLVQLVLELRNALGDREQLIVKTVPRRGYIFVAPIEWLDDHRPAPSGGRSRALWQTLAGAAVLLCAAAALAVRASPPRSGVDAEVAAGAFPVFVAPFVEVDIDGESSLFGRRLAGDVSAEFVRWKTRLLTSAEGARFVVSGRLLRRGTDGVRLDAQVRDLSDGRVYPLILATFETEEDVVRSELPIRVVRAFANRRDEIALVRARRPDQQPDAAGLLHLAWNDYNLARTEADLERAIDRFEAVLRKDPTSVFARVGRSVACLQIFSRLHSAAPEVQLGACERQIRELYEKAPENVDAMQAMAGLLSWRGKPDEAVWLLRKSLELSPLHRMGNAMMSSVLVKQGRFDEAAPYIEITRTWAERRSEHGPSDQRRQAYYYQLFAETAFFQGHDDECRAWLRRWAAEMPDNGRPYLMLAALDALDDRGEEARANMARHRELLPRSNLRYVAMLYPGSAPESILVRRARLLDGIRKAGLPEGA